MMPAASHMRPRKLSMPCYTCQLAAHPSLLLLITMLPDGMTVLLSSVLPVSGP